MINLSFDELRLIAQTRNISDCENKSKEQSPTPETPTPETPKTPKPETPKTPKPKPVNKKKLKKLRKDFDGLRHKFSKKEIDRYRKAFHVAKNKKISF